MGLLMQVVEAMETQWQISLYACSNVIDVFVERSEWLKMQTAKITLPSGPQDVECVKTCVWNYEGSFYMSHFTTNANITFENRAVFSRDTSKSCNNLGRQRQLAIKNLRVFLEVFTGNDV